MSKIKVKICLGTKCYLFGAGDILESFEELDQNIQDAFEIEGSTCLGPCDKKKNKTPIIKVGEDYHFGVRPEEFEQILKDYLKTH